MTEMTLYQNYIQRTDAAHFQAIAIGLEDDHDDHQQLLPRRTLKDRENPLESVTDAQFRYALMQLLQIGK